MDRLHMETAVSKLRNIPRLNIGFYPTPIEELARFREAIGGGPRLFIKRDDYTGAGMGGNKVRKLEYLLAQAVDNGADTAITIGSEKSNHARVTAALCARLGLRCILVLNRTTQSDDSLKPASITVDEIVGAEIHLVADRKDRMPTLMSIAEKLRGEGSRVVEIPLGASTPLGALGYVRAIEEAATQLKAMDVKPDYIFHSSSSGGTQAGLIVGSQIFGLESAQIVGVSPDDPAESISAEVKRIAVSAGELLGLDDNQFREDATVSDQFVGEGYSIPSKESASALGLLAQTEGILLDPIYTAKAMAALIDWVKRGRISQKETALFWHTGGQLAMFYSPPVKTA
jgi:D-cysteine desulfhydrase